MTDKIGFFDTFFFEKGTMNKIFREKIEFLADYLGCNKGELVFEMDKIFSSHIQEIEKKLKERKMAEWSKFHTPPITEREIAQYEAQIRFNQALDDVLTMLKEKMK